jgi:hypothetical protein
LRQFAQPPLDPVRLDVRKILAVYPRLTAIAAGQPIGVGEDVFPIDLVVQDVEAKIRRLLRLSLWKCLLKFLYLYRSL